MNLLKIILKSILILIGVLFITILIILGVDAQSTSYLKIKKSEFLNNDTYLITNVNIIPMNPDTILVDKMVYIKDGIIQNMAYYIDIKDIELLMQKINSLLLV